jgi:excisionase family DNA binding protein
MADVSVREAAARLGVDRSRVQRLVARGELPARRVGSFWVVPSEAIERLRARPRPAHRPVGPRMAWGQLWAGEGRDAPWLSSAEQARARRRARAASIGEWRSAAARRAQVHRLYAHPSVVGRLLDAPGVVRSGASAASDVVAVGEAEGYVQPERLAPLVEKYALVPSERPNVVLRVPEGLWPFAKGERVAPRAVVAVDLLDADDPRSRREGERLLESVLEWLRES